MFELITIKIFAVNSIGFKSQICVDYAAAVNRVMFQNFR